MAIFFAVIIALGYAVAWYSGTPPIGPVTIAAAIAIVMALISYFSGDKIALAAAGAQEIDRESNPYLYRLVENLCITAGMKSIPRIYVIADPAINAFATGRDPAHASIAVTTGAMEQLENEELEGVLAHELSHIQNYDIRLMTVVIVLVGVISLIADMFWYGGFGRRSRDEENNGANIFAIIGVMLIILSPIIAKLIQLAISRRREYLADASGALLTRYPEGLARALEKIAQYNQPMRRKNHATAHLYLESPFRTPGKRIASLFDTHPPLEERIRILRTMA